MERVAITDDEVVYRRIFYANTYPPHSKKPSKPPGAVNSTAFVEHSEPMQHISVELERLTTLEECIGRGRGRASPRSPLWTYAASVWMCATPRNLD